MVRPDTHPSAAGSTDKAEYCEVSANPGVVNAQAKRIVNHYGLIRRAWVKYGVNPSFLEFYKMFSKRFLGAALAVSGMILLPTGAQAESDFVTGPGNLSASAELDFSITIPRFVYLRVGTENSPAADVLTYSVSPQEVGNNSPIAGTGGDLTGGVVTAEVRSNIGTVALTATTAGELQNNANPLETISWGQIEVTTQDIGHPVLADGATNSISLPQVSGVTNLSGQWTFRYKNEAIVPAGTYEGSVAYSVAIP